MLILLDDGLLLYGYSYDIANRGKLTEVADHVTRLMGNLFLDEDNNLKLYTRKKIISLTKINYQLIDSIIYYYKEADLNAGDYLLYTIDNSGTLRQFIEGISSAFNTDFYFTKFFKIQSIGKLAVEDSEGNIHALPEFQLLNYPIRLADPSRDISHGLSIKPARPEIE